MGKDQQTSKILEELLKAPHTDLMNFHLSFPSPFLCLYKWPHQRSEFMQCRSLGLLNIFCPLYLACLYILSALPLNISQISPFFPASSYVTPGFHLLLFGLLQKLVNWFPHIYSYFLVTSRAIFSSHIIHHVTLNSYLTLVPFSVTPLI